METGLINHSDNLFSDTSMRTAKIFYFLIIFIVV